jgi:hypothetical protein
VLAWSSNQGMSPKNFDPIANDFDGGDGSLWRTIGQKIGQSSQIGKRTSGVDYFRHTRTFGRVVRSPRTRAAK